MKKQNLDALVNLAARRNIIIPAFSIYGELGGFYDYGPIGTRIKHNIERVWRNQFIESMGNLEVEATLIAPEQVFEASGHISHFTDPITVCSKCKSSYRADKLLEEFYTKKKDQEMVTRARESSPEELEELLKENSIKCEKCGTQLDKVTMFNLMMQTKIGPTLYHTGYLRPETAQGIFLDFKNIFRNSSLKLPVGIGQIGKAFRNEISPRRMLIRMREFSMMELEYFFDPTQAGILVNNEFIDEEKVFKSKINFLSREQQEQGEKRKEDYTQIMLSDGLEKGLIPNKMFAFLLYKEKEFMLRLGFPEESFRFRQMLTRELPHYSKGNIDLEVRFEDSYEEMAGNAYRTDFDLMAHQKHSKTDMSIMIDDKRLVPHVVELSFGLDRLFWALLYNSLYYDEKREWEVLLLREEVAPYTYAVFPLQKDEKLVEKALEADKYLRESGVSSYYSATGSIGKRYAKADEIGISNAITVDYKSLEDNTVTVRNIKDANQVRKHVGEI